MKPDTYHKQQAKKLGVVVKPSTNPKKKLDVFKDNKKMASIGAEGYRDYNSYKKKEGLAVADVKRKSYIARHKCAGAKKDTPNYYSCNILWGK
tara:strand:- start:612 stop:890 length:279 start_codon:yes stop_codon:yes gene_type:complete